MQRLDPSEQSSLGKTVRLRLSRPLFKRLKQHLTSDARMEQFAFALFSQARTAEGTILIVRDLFLPDRGDLAEQSAGCVAPTKRFQDAVYLIAQQRGLGILDIHTHPHQGSPRFSGIDQGESSRNGQYISRTFPAPATHAMVVFGNDATAHDAVVYDRLREGYRTIDCLEILGRGMQVFPTNPRNRRRLDDPRFHRHALIPGWDQQTLAEQRIVIVGAGGNGAHLVQTLISMGAGSQGWIAVVDPDVVEASNLPRIPYAFAEHLGQPKVTVAAQYAGRKNPSTSCFPYPCSVTEPCVQDRLKAATVIFGAADNDGVRKGCNETSVRYQIPYIDLGCDIQIEEKEVAAGGQVRVVLPGTNACLVCCQGYDPAAAAIDLMDESRAAIRAAHGYVRGSAAQPTPSIAALNAHTAQLAVQALLGLAAGSLSGDWDCIWFDLISGETTAAKTKRREDCPLCGAEGILAMGDEIPREPTDQAPNFSPIARKSERVA